MDAGEMDRRLVQLEERLAKLSAEDRERALEGFAQVLNLLALPRETGAAVELTISLARTSDVTHRSG